MKEQSTNVMAKPLPTVSEDGQPFWEACRRREFLLQRCQQCREFQFPPRSICSHCAHRRVTWEPASGLGRIYSFTIVHRPPEPSFAQDVPYVVAVIDLDEGPRMMSNIKGCPPEAVSIGMRVSAVFEERTAEVVLIQFRPVDTAAAKPRG